MPALRAILVSLLMLLTTVVRARGEDVRHGPLRTLDGPLTFTPPADSDAWSRRREEVRRRMLVALGLWPEPTRTPLAPVIHGRIDRGDHTVEKVIFESLPGLFVTGNLYRPVGAKGRVPAVLFAHGHWADARLSDEPRPKLLAEIASGGERFERGGRSRFQSLCVQLARMGCVVWQWDMLGNSDSRQITAELAHRFVGQRPGMNGREGWGLFSPRAEARLQNVMGLQAWNAVRSLDFVRSLPEVDPDRVAATGASGGATQTFVLAGIDDRLALSYPVSMVSTTMQGGCVCENAPLLRIGTGNVEFAALFAPKPQGMNTADDWTRGLAAAGFPELKRLYTLLGAKDSVALQRGEHFPHNYNAVTRGGFYDFLDRHFRLGHERPVIESDYEPLPAASLTVWDADHPAPPQGDPGFERRLLAWLDADATAQLTAAAATPEGLERLLRPALEVLVGRTIATAGRVTWEPAADDRRRGVLRNETHGEEVNVTWIDPETPSGDVVIWLGDGGRRCVEENGGTLVPAVRRLLDSGATVVAADLFRQAEPEPARNRVVAIKKQRDSAADTFCYNHSLFAQRTHDVLTVAAFLQAGGRGDRPRPGRILLAAFGETGPIAVAARAVSGRVIARAAVDTGGLRFADLDDWRDARFLPGAAKYLDLPGLLAAQAPQPLWISGEPAGLPSPVAAAYRACGADRPTIDAGPPAEAPAAAVEWLITPSDSR